MRTGRHANNRAPRDGRCTKYLTSGAGRCPNAALDGGIRCAVCLRTHKDWGMGTLKARKAKAAPAESAPAVLPDWMSNPSLLPKRPPGAA